MSAKLDVGNLVVHRKQILGETVAAELPVRRRKHPVTRSEIG
jgi:hypothetical protein